MKANMLVNFHASFKTLVVHTHVGDTDTELHSGRPQTGDLDMTYNSNNQFDFQHDIP
jgi:hypothetical protein